MTHELKTGGDRGYLRIATEEAFATREQIDAICASSAKARPTRASTSLVGLLRAAVRPSARGRSSASGCSISARCRIADMDATGIDNAILALTAPGVQRCSRPRRPSAWCARANDHLADAVRAPSRPLRRHDLDRAAGSRVVGARDRRGKELGFKGVHGQQPHPWRISRRRRSSIRSSAPAPRSTSRSTSIPQSPPDRMIGADGRGRARRRHLRLRRRDRLAPRCGCITSGVFDRYPSLQIMRRP